MTVLKYLVCSLAATISFASTTSQAADSVADTNRPNIVLIVADDLGYHDVGFQGGNAHVATPNIDSIAKNGVTFTNGYVTGTVCSPTRAGLLTGRYQQRFGHEFNPGPGRQPQGVEFGLPKSERTIANELKDAGYTTASIGKWHLGNGEGFHPSARGFDEWYGFLGGAHSYVPGSGNGNAAAPIYRNGEKVDSPEHLTVAFGQEAVAFVKRQSADKPYFLYLPFNAVHTPLQPDKANAAKFAHIENTKQRNYAGLLSGLDQAVGEVLAAIRDSGQEDNTLIFFVGDNGGPQAGNGSNNAPLRGDKGTVFEGGVRVPFVAQWKNRLPAGAKYEQSVISLDITATVAAVAGAKLGTNDRPADGVDLIPHVLGDDNNAPHDALFWRAGPQWAVRQGDFKLLHRADGDVQLYNLAKDIGESQNLAADHADKVAELKATYAAWDAKNVPALWKRAQPRGQRAGRRARQEQGNQTLRRAESADVPAS